jgi:3-O-methylgallate 3,4-dioxygenase
MSRLVAVAGSSHSPMLAPDPETVWAFRASSDMKARYHDRDGIVRASTDIAAARGDELAAELSPAVWQSKWATCQAASARLGHDLLALDLDLVVVVGDDQGEVFDLGNNPAISIYYGDELTVAEPDPDASFLGAARAQLVKILSALGNDGSTYKVDADAAHCIISSLVGQGFDIATSNRLPAGRSFGHAFSWVLSRLLDHATVPTIPILVNTYFPPNQPTAARCLDLGTALRAAIDALPGDRRVAVVASGGLSHFVINEALDDAVVSAMQTGDTAVLRALPEELLQEGNSEIKNWITTIGAGAGMRCEWFEYVRGYRTLAGTGVGLAFGLWTAHDEEEDD